MDDDGDWVTCAVDLASGSALPLLYSLYALGGDSVLGVGLSLGGGAAALVVSSVGQGLLLSDPRRDGGAISEDWERALGAVLQLLGAALKVGLSASQLFSQAGVLDADVGAGLYAIPVFALLGMQGIPGHRAGVRTVRSMVAALSILVVACAWASVTYDLNPGPHPQLRAVRAETERGWWWRLLFLCNTVFAYSDVIRKQRPGRERDWMTGWQPFAVRAAVFAGLSLAPRILSLLLTERQPRWLFILQNVLLIHSSILQTSTARRLLAHMRFPPPLDFFRVEHPQRALLLWLAPVLATASVFQWANPDRASEAVLILSALGVAAWVLRRFGGGSQ